MLPRTLTMYAMKNDLAQLFLEAMYSDRQENNRQDKTFN